MIIMNVLNDVISYYPEVSSYLHLILSCLFKQTRSSHQYAHFLFSVCFCLLLWSMKNIWVINSGNLLSFLLCFISGIVWACFCSTFYLWNRSFNGLPVSLRLAFYKLLPASVLSILTTDLSSTDFILLCFLLPFIGIMNCVHQILVGTS